MQLAQDISSRMHIKKRRRSGLRRGFLTYILGEIEKNGVYNVTGVQVKYGGHGRNA